MLSKITSFAARLPSIAWVILLPLLLIGFIGSIITLFWLIASVEGIASLIFLVVGWAAFRWNPHGAGASFMTAGAIVFYALMGMAVDQPGNYFFNQPIAWWQCPAQTRLARGVNVSHPLPERTDLTQAYTCVSEKGDVIKRINMGTVIGVRFVEYVLIAYFFLYGHQAWKRLHQQELVG